MAFLKDLVTKENLHTVKVRRNNWATCNFFRFNGVYWENEDGVGQSITNGYDNDWQLYTPEKEKVQYCVVMYRFKGDKHPNFSNFAVTSKKIFLAYHGYDESSFEFIELIPIGEKH